MQDALDKEYSCLAFGGQMKAAIQLISSAMDVLTKLGGFTQRNLSLDILEGVAKMRYGLSVVAELLQMQVNEVEGTSTRHSQKLYGSVSSRLIAEARYVSIYTGAYTSKCNIDNKKEWRQDWDASTYYYGHVGMS